MHGGPRKDTTPAIWLLRGLYPRVLEPLLQVSGDARRFYYLEKMGYSKIRFVRSSCVD